eukprot:459276-Alexandrium_andersonii.AAC.1
MRWQGDAEMHHGKHPLTRPCLCNDVWARAVALHVTLASNPSVPSSIPAQRNQRAEPSSLGQCNRVQRKRAERAARSS